MKRSSHFSTSVKQSYANTLLGFIRASYTVFYIRAPIHAKVATRLKDSAQPVQLPLEQELKTIHKVLAINTAFISSHHLKQKDLLGLMGVLMQFTSPVPQLRPYCETPYAHVDKLYKEIVKKGEKSPLGFADQLAIALSQTKGDLPEAVWRLFITSRQYARWYDTEAIADIPAFDEGEILDRMTNWSKAIKATKAYGTGPHQDAAGDVYYCWTHTLAKLAFQSLATKQTVLTRLEAKALEHGTLLNHKLAHKTKPQGVQSDHTIAAAYGNAIGEVLALIDIEC